MAYIIEMWTRPITVVELTSFSREAVKIWSDEERVEFIDYMAKNPAVGDVVPDTGGLRKVRWGRAGSGKRGGVRVIYFFHDLEHPLFLIALYAKADRGDISPEKKKLFADFVANLKKSYRD